MVIVSFFFISFSFSLLADSVDGTRDGGGRRHAERQPQRAYSRFSGLDVKLTCFDAENSEDFTPTSSQ